MNHQNLNEPDWLLEEFTSNQAKDAVILSMTALIQISKQCIYPPLTLEEMQQLMESVWYEMESQDSQAVPL